MNLPSDWSAHLRHCPRGHLWHESEGRECSQCEAEEGDREQLRMYWPLNLGGFTVCPDYPAREQCCKTCGWPRERHIPH